MIKQSVASEYLVKNNLRVIEYDDTRPWGAWYIIDEGDDYSRSDYFTTDLPGVSVNSKSHLCGSFDKKVIKVVPKTALSLQFHGQVNRPGHSEIWIACTKIRVVAGCASVINCKTTDFAEQKLLIIDINPNGRVHIPAGYLHALVNPYSEDIFLIETRVSSVSESSAEREGNITRVYDQTKRGGAELYPEDIMSKMMDPDLKADIHVGCDQLVDLQSIT